MKASELVSELQKAGATLRVERGELRVRAPLGVLTEERQSMLRAHKPELVKLLSTYPCTSCKRFAFSQPNTLCYWCGKPRGMVA